MVTKIGTAMITAQDEQGRAQQIAISNCLISPRFPCKLLSLSALTKKGLTATMTNDAIRLTNTTNNIVLIGRRDTASQLFLLQEAQPQQQFESALMAKSYQASKNNSDTAVEA